MISAFGVEHTVSKAFSGNMERSLMRVGAGGDRSVMANNTMSGKLKRHYVIDRRAAGNAGKYSGAEGGGQNHKQRAQAFLTGHANLNRRRGRVLP